DRDQALHRELAQHLADRGPGDPELLDQLALHEPLPGLEAEPEDRVPDERDDLLAQGRGHTTDLVGRPGGPGRPRHRRGAVHAHPSPGRSQPFRSNHRTISVWSASGSSAAAASAHSSTVRAACADGTPVASTRTSAIRMSLSMSASANPESYVPGRT